MNPKPNGNSQVKKQNTLRKKINKNLTLFKFHKSLLLRTLYYPSVKTRLKMRLQEMSYLICS
jgi:hypothetical protein